MTPFTPCRAVLAYPEMRRLLPGIAAGFRLGQVFRRYEPGTLMLWRW